ncbi:MAG: fluoride efflux transporter FluC [Gemmatimonadaceae bacterium]
MLIWIAIGGAAGSVSRYLLGGVVQRASAAAFPFGTLAVNVIGCSPSSPPSGEWPRRRHSPPEPPHSNRMTIT